MNGKINPKPTNSSNNSDKKSTADMLAEDAELVTAYQLDDPNVISLTELQEQEMNLSAGNALADDTLPVEVADAQSIGGHMPDPDSDDDILSAVQTMGIGLDEDEENPAELNIAHDVELGEKEHWEN